MDRLYLILLFFFQAEDGIRDKLVTGVQTCALPISSRRCKSGSDLQRRLASAGAAIHRKDDDRQDSGAARSEERRVGKSVDLGGRRIIKKKNHNKNQHLGDNATDGKSISELLNLYYQ